MTSSPDPTEQRKRAPGQKDGVAQSLQDLLEEMSSMDATRPFTVPAATSAVPTAKPARKPISKVWRYLIILVLLGAAVNVLLPRLADLRGAVKTLEEMTWWIVGLAIIAQTISYLGYGFCISAILANNGKHLNVFRGALIALASTSIGLVAGGWVAAAAAAYKFTRTEDVDRSTASMAGILPSLLVNATIILISIIGIIFLLFVHQIDHAQLLQYSIFIGLLALVSFGGMAALAHPKFSYKFVNWALWTVARIRKKPYDPANTRSMLDSFARAWRALRHGNWIRPMLGAVILTGFDMLTLYFVFLAAGTSVKAGVLFAGYGLPLLLSKMAFFFPGGIGIIEASMTALFTSLGIASGTSVVAVIGYRLLSFWVPILLGFAATALLSRGSRSTLD